MPVLNFDANTVAPATGVPDPVPAAWYNIAMTESDVKPTKAGDGMRLEVVFTILDGEYVGRKLYEGYNIQNPNPTAVKIAWEQISAIGHAVGVLHIANSELLHNRPLMAKVKVVPAQMEAQPNGAQVEKYPAKNEIQAYRAPGQGGAAPGAVVAGAPAYAPVAPPPAQVMQAAAPPAAIAQPQQWTPPAGTQPWQQPAAAAAPAQQQQAAPVFAPPAAAAAPQQAAQQPAPVAAQAPAQAAAPLAGLPATPPWLQNQQPAA